MSQTNRIGNGLTDRGKTLSFTFDGKRFEGHPGDTLASALLANGVNVSEDGMRVEANCQLSIDSRGTLQFFLPGERERMTLEGRVRLAVDEVQLLYTIEFLDLAPQHRARIRQYVEQGASAA